MNDFKKSFIEGFIRGLILLAVGFIIGYGLCYKEQVKPLAERNEFKKELIVKYECYYKAVETALDTLEHYDNWVDRFDFEEYYDTRAQLDSLYKSEM